jgi:hypothetical protein
MAHRYHCPASSPPPPTGFIYGPYNEFTAGNTFPSKVTLMAAELMGPSAMILFGVLDIAVGGIGVVWPMLVALVQAAPPVAVTVPQMPVALAAPGTSPARVNPEPFDEPPPLAEPPERAPSMNYAPAQLEPMAV